jgi:chromosome partitioning protein
MKIWSFVSQKGGCGKSTLATQLSVIAVQKGERTVIVDLDPQQSSRAWQRVRSEERPPACVTALPANLPRVIESAKQFDQSLMLLDTAPHTDSDARVAINASDLIICPTQASLFDLESLQSTAELLEITGKIGQAVVVVNAIPPKNKEVTYGQAAAKASNYGLRVCDHYVCNRVAFVEATNKGRGVVETVSKSDAASEIRELWDELLGISEEIRVQPKALPPLRRIK